MKFFLNIYLLFNKNKVILYIIFTFSFNILFYKNHFN